MTVRIPRALVLAILAAVTIAAVSINAVGAPTRPSAERLKEPKAAAAAVHGVHFVYGRPVTARAASDTFGVVTPAFSVANCPRGLHALGGGYNSNDTTTDPVTISSNEPGKGISRWLVVAEDTSTSDTATGFTFEAVATCA